MPFYTAVTCTGERDGRTESLFQKRTGKLLPDQIFVFSLRHAVDDITLRQKKPQQLIFYQPTRGPSIHCSTELSSSSGVFAKKARKRCMAVRKHSRVLQDVLPLWHFETMLFHPPFTLSFFLISAFFLMSFLLFTHTEIQLMKLQRSTGLRQCHVCIFTQEALNVADG